MLTAFDKHNHLRIAGTPCHRLKVYRSLLIILLLMTAIVETRAEDKLPELGTGTDSQQADDDSTADGTNTSSTLPAGETPARSCDRTQEILKQEAHWYDSAHAYMNTAFCEPAIWFDDFFASDRVLEEVGGSYVRWRNDFVQNEEDGFDFNTNLNFSVELPKISSKLQLIFEGDEDQDL